jgi:putative transposase
LRPYLRKSNEPIQHKNKFGPQSQNLASIIRGFKIGITKYARINGIDFYWQQRYYDHIIRNEIELERIRKYILENPSHWSSDI